MLALKSPAALMSINCDSGLTRARLPEPSTERLIGTIAATGGFTPSTKVDRRDGQRRGEPEPPAVRLADSNYNLPERRCVALVPQWSSRVCTAHFLK